MKNSKWFKALFTIGAVAIGIGMLGCGGSPKKRAGDHLTAWYDVYGNFCHYGDPTSGCNFYKNGDKVMDYEDIYFDCCYNLEYDVWFYYDSYGNSKTYAGWAWISNSGILYDEWGYALNKEKDTFGSDLIADVGAEKEALIQKAGESFAREYNLQADVGLSWARGLNKSMELRLARSRSADEYNKITKQLSGISVKKGERALRKALAGDESEALTLLNETMARHMRTTASNTRTMLERMFSKEFKAYEDAKKSGETLTLFKAESDSHKKYLESDEYKAALEKAKVKESENSDVLDDIDGDEII